MLLQEQQRRAKQGLAGEVLELDVVAVVVGGIFHSRRSGLKGLKPGRGAEVALV